LLDIRYEWFEGGECLIVVMDLLGNGMVVHVGYPEFEQCLRLVKTFIIIAFGSITCHVVPMKELT
jgi:hypothetical protein